MVLACQCPFSYPTLPEETGKRHHKFYHHVLGPGSVSGTGARAAASPRPPSPSSEPRAQREEEDAVCSGQQDRVVGRKELFTLAGGGEGEREEGR